MRIEPALPYAKIVTVELTHRVWVAMDVQIVYQDSSKVSPVKKHVKHVVKEHFRVKLVLCNVYPVLQARILKHQGLCRVYYVNLGKSSL